jgi:predicted 3-demethylubiquinone-9 3-methyltransferase (glyoxalase superfamily)
MPVVRWQRRRGREVLCLLFYNSHVDAVHRAPSDYPSGKAGDVLLVEFTLISQPFSGLNGGPQFKIQ